MKSEEAQPSYSLPFCATNLMRVQPSTVSSMVTSAPLGIRTSTSELVEGSLRRRSAEPLVFTLAALSAGAGVGSPLGSGAGVVAAPGCAVAVAAGVGVAGAAVGSTSDR